MPIMIQLFLLFVVFLAIFFVLKKLIDSVREPFDFHYARRRNTKAAMLCKKLDNKEKLSILESASLETYLHDGIISKEKNGSYVISSKALLEAVDPRTIKNNPGGQK